MSKIDAVIFDMDGTLLDSETFAFGVWEKALLEFGFDLTHDFFVSMVGSPSSRVIQMFRDYYGADFPIGEIRARKVEIELKSLETEIIDLRHGALESLDYLDTNNIPYGLATSSEKIRAIARLKSAGILERFDTMICGDQVKNQKPDPESYHVVANMLGVDIKKTLIIEDSPSGIQGAINSGATVCWFKDLVEIDHELKGQVRVIESLSEIILFV